MLPLTDDIDGTNDATVMAPLVDDIRWLIGPEGAGWLSRTAADFRPLPTLAKWLRKSIGADRARLVLQQVELRRRARAKFAQSDRMFFTRVGLEQATDQWVAAHKARRFPAQRPIADLCCGIGGDLTALARCGPATGVDRDEITALFAAENLCAAAEWPGAEFALLPTKGEGPGARGTVVAADATHFPLGDFAAWHLDPDRRPAGRRTTHLELHEPDLPAVERMLRVNPHAAIKLAPACEPPEAWRHEAELEWISRDRQCRQMVAWCGRLADHPGRRRATILGSGVVGAPPLRSVLGDEVPLPLVAARLCRYVLDPDPAVVAAGLAGTVAVEHELSAVDPRAVYLTGDRPVADAAIACFEVCDSLPFDLKRLKSLLRSRGIGRLEIKSRGVPDDPQSLRRRLGLRGDQAAVLLLVRVGRSVTAIVARRTGTAAAFGP